MVLAGILLFIIGICDGQGQRETVMASSDEWRLP